MQQQLLPLFKQRTPLDFQNAKKGFVENLATHLAFAAFAIRENDRHFLDLEAVFPGPEFHFNLESVTDETRWFL